MPQCVLCSWAGARMCHCVARTGLVLVPWGCLWGRERVGDPGSPRQGEELDCPEIGNSLSGSSAGLVWEEVRCGHGKNVSSGHRDGGVQWLSPKSPAGRMCREPPLVCWALCASAPVLSLALPSAAPPLHSGNCRCLRGASLLITTLS